MPERILNELLGILFCKKHKARHWSFIDFFHKYFKFL
jgi:hypothetical protein